jgi:uncharacterized membrane protein YkoI
MKNILKKFASTMLLASTLIACAGNSDEVEIPVSAVPANIITHVQNTLPGISITEAEKKIKNDTIIYELEGRLINGKQYEIKISENSTIIKIDLED